MGLSENEYEYLGKLKTFRLHLNVLKNPPFGEFFSNNEIEFKKENYYYER